LSQAGGMAEQSRRPVAGADGGAGRHERRAGPAGGGHRRDDFVIGTFGFCIAWLFTDIFQLGTLSHIDASGRYVALVPAAQGIAQTAAPAIAGFLLSRQLGYSAVMLLGAAGSLCALVIYAVVYTCLRRLAPALADAV